MLYSVDSDKYLSSSASALEGSPEADGLNMLLPIVNLFTHGANIYINTSLQHNRKKKPNVAKWNLR